MSRTTYATIVFTTTKSSDKRSSNRTWRQSWSATRCNAGVRTYFRSVLACA